MPHHGRSALAAVAATAVLRPAVATAVAAAAVAVASADRHARMVHLLAQLARHRRGLVPTRHPAERMRAAALVTRPARAADLRKATAASAVALVVVAEAVAAKTTAGSRRFTTLGSGLMTGRSDPL